MSAARTPSDLKYTSEHEWIRVEGDIAVVGITDYAQKELGDIVFIETPAAGKKVAQHGALGIVESVKAASDIFSPLSGTVEAANEALADNPGIVNRDAYGAGWIAKIRIENRAELDALLDAAAYGKLIAEAKKS